MTPGVGAGANRASQGEADGGVRDRCWPHAAAEGNDNRVWYGVKDDEGPVDGGRCSHGQW
jgi:hypothetical protein